MKTSKSKKKITKISSSQSNTSIIQNTSKTKTERVKVSIRVRPFNEDEKKLDDSTPIEKIDKMNNTMIIKRDFDKKNFSFDNIFPMDTSQISVFDITSKEVVNSVLKGYNGTIFAYGQTGSGKTYTMVGNFENNETKGIIPRSFDYIFNEIKKDKEHKYNIKISFIQIYLETIQDLLEPLNKEIRIREDPEYGVYLEGVQWIQVNSTTECSKIFKIGEKNRVTESTMMNTYSSRSHAILIAKIEKNIILSKEKILELSKESNEKIKAERVMTNSFLYLVDLAGSERVKKSKAVNMRLEEAKKINYSLLILGNCIQSLTETKPTYIAYRDSKLTRLLQESLGGNAKTSLIVTISPSGYNTDETISSLNFALRAMKVQNKPIINRSVDYQALCIKLQEDLDKLNDEYTELKINYDKLEEKYEKLKNGETFIEIQKKNIQNNLIIIDSKNNNNININSKKAKNQNNKNNNNKLEIEIKKLEEYYKNMMKNKEEEYEKSLKEIENILLKNEEISKKNMELKKEIEINKESINDLIKEKQDLMNTISDLTNKLNYEKESKEIKTKEEHKKELDKLFSQIEILENKIIPLENSNTLNNDSILSIKSKIFKEINKLKEEKNIIIQEKNINTKKIIENDKKLENINKEKKGKKEEKELEEEIIRENNNKLKDYQNYLIERITRVEMEIKRIKDITIKIEQIKQEDLTNKDKTDLVCENELNKIKIFCITKRYEESNDKIKKYLEQFWDINRNNDILIRNNKNLQKELNNIKTNEKENIRKLKEEINKEKKEKEEYRNNIINLNKKNKELMDKLKESQQKSENEIEKLKNELEKKNKILEIKIKEKEKKINELNEEMKNKDNKNNY